MKLPGFVQQEIQQIHTQLAPEKTSLELIMLQQAVYNKKAIWLQGTVTSVVSIDEMDSQTVGTWFMNLPTTVQTTASATCFYLQDARGQQILVKYPSDVDVSAMDNVTVVGIFRAHGVIVETKGLLRTKQEELNNSLGEPFIGAITVENQTKQKMEYIRQNL
ncbi:MAG: hypothetical protein NWF01_03075 [Candidatus Bathyarchaeota archaeon]|nr:hypothetical protein [Candidatus Bathyarchaeota archaeon]